MRSSAAVFVALVLLVTGCAGGSDESSPDDDASESSAAAEDQTPADALKAGLGELRRLHTISFRAEILFSGQPLFVSSGVAETAGSWEALNEMHFTDGVVRQQVRSAGGEVWLKDSLMPAASRGCWLSVPSDQAPFGVGAQMPGLPELGYVGWLSDLQAKKWSSGLRDGISAEMPLAAAYGLLPSNFRDLEEVTETEPVEALVKLEGSQVHQLVIYGADIVDALVQAGMDDEERRIDDFEIRIFYEGAEESLRVSPPRADEITMDPETGCGRSA